MTYSRFLVDLFHILTFHFSCSFGHQLLCIQKQLLIPKTTCITLCFQLNPNSDWSKVNFLVTHQSHQYRETCLEIVTQKVKQKQVYPFCFIYILIMQKLISNELYLILKLIKFKSLLQYIQHTSGI